MRAALTTIADVVGVLLLTAAAYFIYRPAALAVLGLASLLASWQHAAPADSGDEEGPL